MAGVGGGGDRRAELRAWSAGMDVAVGTFAGGFLGWLIDGWLGHRPWWMLGLGLAGMMAGGYRLIKEGMAMNREASRAFAARYRPGAGGGSGGDGPRAEKAGGVASPGVVGPAILEPSDGGPGARAEGGDDSRYRGDEHGKRDG